MSQKRERGREKRKEGRAREKGKGHGASGEGEGDEQREKACKMVVLYDLNSEVPSSRHLCITARCEPRRLAHSQRGSTGM